MRVSIALACLTVSFALACKRGDSAPAPARSALPAQVASAAPPASQAAAPPARPENPVERRIPGHHEALANLYAARVRFYGARKTVAEIVGAKRMAFAKEPEYRQRVGEVQIEKTPKGYNVRFEKHSGANLASVVPARLVLEADGDKLLIVEETDAVTDERLKKPAASPSCYAAVSQIVATLPAIETDIRRVTRANAQVKAGGIVYEEEPGRLEAAQGYFHSDRFEPRWWIEAIKGELTIKDALSGEQLAISEGQRAGVRQACAEPDADAGTDKK